jgi:succinate dehydrogenase / fumarate reductase flavoprotein subunit
MGGLWVNNDNQMTNIPGLFAAGECEYQYHGANRLGANSLLSCTFGGFVAGTAASEYIKNLNKSVSDVKEDEFKKQIKTEEDQINEILNQNGSENARQIHVEMGDLMTANVTVVRDNKKLEATIKELAEFQNRLSQVKIPDSGKWANQSLFYSRELSHMLDIAKIITAGALARNESRGAHYKPEFPDGEPVLSYQEVDISLAKPVKRDYTK